MAHERAKSTARTSDKFVIVRNAQRAIVLSKACTDRTLCSTLHNASGGLFAVDTAFR